MTERFRYWGKIDPQQRAHLELVAPREQAEPATASSKTAVFQIYDPIDSWGAPFGISAKEFGAALMSLDTDVETIELRINSPGGEAFEAIAIVNALKAHPAKVVAIVDSLAASCAADIACSADETVMLPGAQLMIHRSWGLELGTAEDLASYATMLANLDNAQADIFVAKAGGTRDEWLAAMTPGTWYSAEQAVEAGLADRTGDAKPVSAKEAQPSQRFDLSMLPQLDAARVPFAPAARLTAPPKASTNTPAEPPVVPSTTPEEADIMSDELITGLRERFGFAEDADTATVLAAIDAAQDPDITPEAIAKAHGITADAAKAALDAAKAGKVAVSQSYLDTIEANAKLGAEARAKQQADERDSAIQAKVAAGIIGRDQVESWQRDWDRDPASAKAELDKLTVARFPVATAPGTPGAPDVDIHAYTDEMAAEDAELFGLPKEAFAR